MPARNTIINRLPAPVNNSVIIEENQTVADIMSTMVYMHNKNERYYDKICSIFLGPTIQDTCENLWDFCKANIPYEVETENLQTVKSPQRILKDAGEGFGHDCKHYASFIGGVLDGLRRKGEKISWVYRFAGYKLFDTSPGHVFVVVKTKGREIWIDPVLDYFDEKKKYQFAVDKNIMSSLGCCDDSLGSVGAVVSGRDNATAATLQTIGGTICAVGGTIAMCIPAGTVVAAVIEVVGFATSFIGKLFQSKYQYTTQVDWLCTFYQRLVLGDPNAHGNHISTGLKEQYVPAAQLWFATVLGVPCWDMLRYHALRGTDQNKDTNLNWTINQKIAAYRAFGSIEANVPEAAVITACNIATTLDDSVGVGGWANFPPANIVLQKEGVTAEQVVQQAEGVLTGSAPNSLPTTTVYTSLGGEMMIPLLIGAGTLLLIATNKNKK